MGFGFIRVVAMCVECNNSYKGLICWIGMVDSITSAGISGSPCYEGPNVDYAYAQTCDSQVEGRCGGTARSPPCPAVEAEARRAAREISDKVEQD